MRRNRSWPHWLLAARLSHPAKRARASTYLAESRLIAAAGAAAALHDLGEIALMRGDNVAAQPLYTECLALYQKLDDLIQQAHALAGLGQIAYAGLDYDQGRMLFLQALALAQAANGRWATAMVLNNLGDLAYLEGDLEQAIALALES